MVKRGLLFVIATFVTFTQSFASEVTFQVDMSNQTVSPSGVHIAGSFADANSDGTIDNPYPNWDPSVLALTNTGNGIWSITLDLAAGSYEYKFINGNVWDITEFFTADAPSITIQVNESDLGSQVIIFNALGQEVFSERIAVVNQLLNIEKLIEGFYFLKMDGRVIRLHVVR